MDYQNYSTDDFIKDESFQRSVFSLDEKDAQFWADFEATFPHKIAEMQEARNFLKLLDFKHQDSVENRITSLKRKIDLAIDDPDQVLEINQPTERKSKSKFYPYSIAASISVILIAFAIWFIPGSGLREFFIWNVHEEITSKGQRNLIVLEDGTSVWLNSESRLKYPSTFKNENTREVYLEGEAFFNVVKNPGKPFVVHTSEISIKVLGTAFNVKSYKQDTFIETTLVHGSVSIEAQDQGKNIQLLPNQHAKFNKHSKELILEETVQTSDYVDWKNGVLIFDEQPFSKVKEALERWYNITIHIEDKSALNCTFSARFVNESLEDVLELFKTSESITYSIEGDQVYISGKLCEGN